MKRSFYILAISALMLISAPAARATVIQFHANLSGANEAPANASPGTGLGIFTLDDSLHTLVLNIVFSGLLGTTTAAHVHCCTAAPFAGTAGVATTTPTFFLFPAGVTSGSYITTLDLTLLSSYNPAFVTANGGTAAGAEARLIAGMRDGKTYLNIHTTTFGGGEIRGFLVPEPGTLALFGLGLFAMWQLTRRSGMMGRV